MRCEECGCDNAFECGCAARLAKRMDPQPLKEASGEEISAQISAWLDTPSGRFAVLRAKRTP